MTQNNLKIAITGGIGSGKSTVAEIIAKQGYKVISCDEIYKTLLNDSAFIKKITDKFEDVTTIKGEIDRKKLSAVVFSDKEKLKELNAITHPCIMKQAIAEMNIGICFCEVPLLFEGGYESLFDKIIVVLRDENQRIASIVERDGLNPGEAKSRINSQYNYDKELFEKYYVLHNDSDFRNLSSATLEILKDIQNQI